MNTNSINSNGNKVTPVERAQIAAQKAQQKAQAAVERANNIAQQAQAKADAMQAIADDPTLADALHAAHYLQAFYNHALNLGQNNLALQALEMLAQFEITTNVPYALRKSNKHTQLAAIPNT